MLRKSLKILRRPLAAALLIGATALPGRLERLPTPWLTPIATPRCWTRTAPWLRAADEDVVTALAQLRPVVKVDRPAHLYRQ